MNVDVIYAHVEDDAQVPAPLPVPSLEVIPVMGDLLSFGHSEDAPVYRVVSRWFTWKSKTDLQIQLLLAHAHPNLARLRTGAGEKGSRSVSRDPVQRRQNPPVLRESERMV